MKKTIQQIQQIIDEGEWIYRDFQPPQVVAGDFKRITIHPDENSEGTLEIDDPLFGEPSQEERDAFIKRHNQFPALTDFIELQEMMRRVSLPKVEKEQQIQCWWTSEGWSEIGVIIFEKASQLRLNPQVTKVSKLENIAKIDGNQVVINL